MRCLSRAPARGVSWAIAVGILLCASFYPTDLNRRYATSKQGHRDTTVLGVEAVAWNINTALPFLTVLALRDVVGLKQLVAISVVGVLASHGPKRLLNDVEIMGTRLGERPSGPTSKHNMPSGHSTLANTGA